MNLEANILIRYEFNTFLSAKFDFPLKNIVFSK